MTSQPVFDNCTERLVALLTADEAMSDGVCRTFVFALMAEVDDGAQGDVQYGGNRLS